uniref:WW domain-containing adapter protein with coiled-coil-like n=1 Tax=Phallusia mammillata TaxID=59560 RepID=A0A6F9DWW6_9ASCI|nr:WW domain-containing adapter protein with coiled-coil-like [Phallusia mammillata]
MYKRGSSQIEGYDPSKKPVMQHMSVSGHRLSSSHGRERDARKSDSSQKTKSSLSHNSKGPSNHVSKSSSDKTKHHKVQGALRGCGNWSEHISSSGKIYFYNNVSEVSQWEKPDDWRESEAIDLKPRDKKSSTQKGQVKSSHSSSHSTSSKTTSHNADDKDYRSRNKDFCDRDYRSKATGGDRDYRGDVDYRDLRTSEQKDSRRQSVNTDKDYRSYSTSTTTTRTQQVVNHVTTSVGSNGQVLTKSESYVPSTGEFYDYSNWDGSKPPPLVEINGTPNSTNNIQLSQSSIDSEKVLSSTNTDDNSSTQCTESAATAFVRTLSNVLTSNNSSNETKGNLENALQLLLKAAKNKASTDTEEALPNGNNTGEPPSKRICTDTERESIDQQPMEINNLESKGEVETMVPEFFQLNALRNVFDPSALLHVQNWPSEHCEKQCHRLADDFYKFMSEHVLDLNAHLTQARSQVRTAEILSTLQEQRVLYIRQQMKDLDRATSSGGPFT